MKSAALNVVIVGRPNVGKSSLFNRLSGKRQAIVHDEAGVTRDRVERDLDWLWGGRRLALKLIDTGGVGGDRFADEILHQVRIALAEANVVLFVMDAEAGILPGDEDLAAELRRRFGRATDAPPIFVIANKVDDEKHEARVGEAYTLGFERVFGISAEHGRGIDDLKDALFEVAAAQGVGQSEDGRGAEVTERTDASALPRLVIVGRPNVGKSTLLNRLFEKERSIVSPIAGTTVDPIDVTVEIGDQRFTLVDTAGVRRKGKTEQGIEVLSVVQTRKALELADVALLVLDGETGITDQDEKIGGLIEEVGCSVVLICNKWDTQRNKAGFDEEVAAELIRKKIAFLRYAPLLFISAKRGTGLQPLADVLGDVLEARALKLSTKEFSELVRAESQVHNPKNAKFFLCHQAGRHPPTFVCHVNDPDKVDFSLKRHLVNALRKRYGFVGSPIRLLCVEGKNRRSLPKSKPKAKPRARLTK